MIGNCKDCLFWKFAGVYVTGMGANQKRERRGDCRFNPPVLLPAWAEGDEGYFTTFPDTKEADACGQFQPKPDAEACPFALAYKRLAVEGKCDAPGSTEYHRVRATWIANGSPTVEGFIVREANRMP